MTRRTIDIREDLAARLEAEALRMEVHVGYVADELIGNGIETLDLMLHAAPIGLSKASLELEYANSSQWILVYLDFRGGCWILPVLSIARVQPTVLLVVPMGGPNRIMAIPRTSLIAWERVVGEGLKKAYARAVKAYERWGARPNPGVADPDNREP